MRDHGPFSHVPAIFRGTAGFFVYTYCRIMLYFQGTGRHSAEEIKKLRNGAIETLGNYAAFAAEKYQESQHSSDHFEPFWILGGSMPTEADFTLFGYLATVAGNPKEYEIEAVPRDNCTLRLT